MTYKRVEDLPVWQEAIKLAEGVFDLTENPKFPCSVSLRDQIERSSMSVSDNIAEGFERGTTNKLLAFLYVARGSAGETRSQTPASRASATSTRRRAGASSRRSRPSRCRRPCWPNCGRAIPYGDRPRKKNFKFETQMSNHV
ncbi:MAG: four helix bundle protein [Verrucomicrobiae bacterium]|nr:four helix bundle protein [Verrucomicrobiae bacterium]